MKVLAVLTFTAAIPIAPGSSLGAAVVQLRGGVGQLAAAGGGRGGSRDGNGAAHGRLRVIQRPSGRRRAGPQALHPGGEEPDEDYSEEADPSIGYEEHVKEVRRRPYLSVLVAVIVGFFAILAYSCVKLALEYRETKRYQLLDDDGECDEDWYFIAYLRYRFSQWFTWTESASTKILIGIFLLFVAFGALTYCLILDTGAPIALWKIVVWLVSPDGGASETTFAGTVIGVFMSLGGLLIFALVLTLVQDSFTAYLDGIKEGCYAVMECNHTVIIGFTGSTVLLLQELCAANEQSGGITISILASQPKPEVELAIKTADFAKKGSRIVVRSGPLHEPHFLKQVAVHTCGTVIILPDENLERELRDASVLRVLIALRGQNWPGSDGRVIVICSLVRNRQLFRRTGGPTTHVMMIDGFVAKLMVQCSRGYGMGMAVISMLGYQDSEFYITQAASHLVGKTLSQASLHFPGAVIVGVSSPAPLSERSNPQALSDRSNPQASARQELADRQATVYFEPNSNTHEKFELCPAADRRIECGDELVLFAATYADTTAKLLGVESVEGSPTLQRGLTVHKRETEKNKETMMIMGWNERVGLMLLELDRVLPSGSSVHILAQEDLESRETFLEIVKNRWSWEEKNITIHHHIGTLGSRYQVEEMQPQVSEASRIFVLADNATNPKCADAIMIATVLQIREVIKKQCETRGEKVKDIPIVPEIDDANAKSMCEYVQIYDYVSSVDLHAQVLATVSCQPKLAPVLDVIISEGGNLEFRMRSLGDYVDPPPFEVCFYQVMAAVQECGDVCFGWTVASYPEGRQLIALNPEDKHKVRPWSETNKIMVLCKIDARAPSK